MISLCPIHQVCLAFNAAVIFFALTTALSSMFNFVWGLKGSTVMQVGGRAMDMAVVVLHSWI